MEQGIKRIQVRVVGVFDEGTLDQNIELTSPARVSDALQSIQHLFNDLSVRPPFKLAVYGQEVSPERVLNAGDRLEILSPLRELPRGAHKPKEH